MYKPHKVLLYADFRSPHSLSWRQGLIEAGIEVIAVSSEYTDFNEVYSPDDFTSIRKSKFTSRSRRNRTFLKGLFSYLLSLQFLHSLIFLTRQKIEVSRLKKIIQSSKPDIIHSLRIPYESVIASKAAGSTPHVISSWGQDFEPQAKYDPLLKYWTKQILKRVSGFHYDSVPDLARAIKYGLSPDIPHVHAAGNFGVKISNPSILGIAKKDVVLYPRKISKTTNYNGFIEAAIALIPRTNLNFIGLGLRSLDDFIEKKHGSFDHNRLILLDTISSDECDRLIASSKIVVSPTYSDGMPNTLLLSLATGAHVIAGKLPQFQQFEKLGFSIQLINPKDVNQIIEAIEIARKKKPKLVQLPEEYLWESNLIRIPKFYAQILNNLK